MMSGNILIVDDNPDNLRVLEEILATAGHTVRAAVNGEIALKAVAARLPDLILLDIMMPGMNGYEVCRRLKGEPATDGIPVLFISALSETEEKLRAFDAGGVDYITKPFVEREVLARVRTHMKLAKAQEQLQQANRELNREVEERKRIEEERLEMERRLLHSQKMESLGVLVGGIAHDFNNLLTSILGNLDLTLLKLPPDLPVRSNIKHALDACQRAAKLIRQMLDYAGKGDYVLTEIDLNDVVYANAALFRASVARNIELSITATLALPRIMADQRHLQQVIMNLVINASEAIGANPGFITISTGVQDCDDAYLSRSRVEEKPPPGRFVCLEVSDTGCGMDEETLLRIFEPFFTTKFMGRGLGMSAVLGIVRAHNGAIMVESKKGAGSFFRVHFPVCRGSAREDRTGIQSEEQPVSSS